ncbi:DNA polymerase IV [Actinoalloteichus hymeniacidonis]|uniref:DNA polymerase IV n=2 Tax=Actinoalloteichus hymeniacidonis TaxID=340345 RepID=A0AAC9HN08_9PSEU|nr:DNA polymerase IV [Actinoalloteichus hymeniacidonis]
MLHIDMDAFFSGVEQLTRPTLRGRAVLVGGAGPRGTVAGASYEARRHGARSAMPMAQARRLCPIATVLPPRFVVYSRASERVFDLLRQFSPVLERISLDEAFTEPPALQGARPDEVTAAVIALRERIRTELGLVASVGAATGKTMAKIASDLAKPDGQLVVPPGSEPATLRNLPVRALWGIGPVSEEKLHRIGVRTLGEFAALSRRDAAGLLGQAIGTELHRLAQGQDGRPVAERSENKQVSAETTFEQDLTDPQRLATEVRLMAESAYHRLIAAHRAARTVRVKVRDADFVTISRSETVQAATTDRTVLTAMAQRLIRAAVPPGTKVRLVGVSLGGLSRGEQEPLFESTTDLPRRAAEVDPSYDGVATQAVVAEAIEQEPEPTPQDPTASDGTEGPDADGTPRWRAGHDVAHPEFGHGWVQGAGVGRVTVRFETQATGPGRTQTFAMTDPLLTEADPLDSLGPAFHRPDSQGH